MSNRRTFAIISHPDAGKTTLTENLLLMGGAIRAALASHGIGLLLCRRPWDQQMNAMATAGFFPFWNKATRFVQKHFGRLP